MPAVLSPPLGSPIDAIASRSRCAVTMALLMASSCALKEHVPFGSGRCVSWLKTKGISEVCVAPKNWRASDVWVTTDIQLQVGEGGRKYIPKPVYRLLWFASRARRDRAIICD